MSGVGKYWRLDVVMHDVIFSIRMSPDTYLHYYRGTAKNIIVRAEDGRKIQFPAKALQPFIKKNGIHGRFRLIYDQQHKFRQLELLSELI